MQQCAQRTPDARRFAAGSLAGLYGMCVEALCQAWVLQALIGAPPRLASRAAHAAQHFSKGRACGAAHRKSGMALEWIQLEAAAG